MTTEAASRAGDDRPLVCRAGPAKFIVCESGSSWVVGLRREAGSWPIRIHETRSLEECRRLLEVCPASFLVVELTRAGLEGLLGCWPGSAAIIPGLGWRWSPRGSWWRPSGCCAKRVRSILWPRPGSWLD